VTYDDWKLRSPDQEGLLEEAPVTCAGCGEDVENCDCDLDGQGPDDENQRELCVLGAECLHQDPFHFSSECFDAAMAEAYYSPGDDGFAVRDLCPCCDQPREIWAPWSPCTDAPEGATW
jgi:hypothetical protein